MKFIISTSTLLKQISTISSLIPSNPVVPILENFLFEIKGGVLHVTASDLQTSAVLTIDNIQADGDLSICVPGKILIDTLRNLPDQPVTFAINFDSYVLEINSDNGRYKISCENAADFPKAPQLGRAEQLDIPTEAMAAALGYTLFATSNDEMKPAMNGVYFHITSKHANFVSSDGHRLIRYRREDIVTTNDVGIIIHKKALTLLKGTLPSANIPLRLEFNTSNAVFSFGHIKIVCRLIDERFPDYENVIPLNNDNIFMIQRNELIASLKRLAIYANKSTNQVRFSAKGNELKVYSEDLDFSNEASEMLYCEHDGRDIEIGFNAKFLIEMLNNMHSPRVTFRLSEPTRAGLITPEEIVENESLIMLVMPIMLSNYSYA